MAIPAPAADNDNDDDCYCEINDINLETVDDNRKAHYENTSKKLCKQVQTLLFILSFFQVGIWSQNDVVSTSMRRDDVASTFIRRHFHVMCPLGSFFFPFFFLLPWQIWFDQSLPATTDIAVPL